MAKMETLQYDCTVMDLTKFVHEDGTSGGATWQSYEAIVSGAIQLTCRSDYAATLKSPVDYDLTNSYFEAQIVGRANVGNGSTECKMQVYKDSANHAELMFVNGNVGYIGTNAGVDFGDYVAYDSVAAKYVRIREASGVLYFEYSANATTWFEYNHYTIGSWVSACRAFFQTGYYGTETTPGTFRVDNINLGASTLVTKTQTSTARIAKTVTKTQSATARIAKIFTKTQGAIARVAKRPTKTQGATARVATRPIKTQGAIARIAKAVNKTQGAIARIMGNVINFTDAFTTQDTSKWTFGSGFSVTGGQLNTAPQSSYPEMVSKYPWNVDESAVLWEFVQAPNVGNGTSTSFFYMRDATNTYGIQFGWDHGVLFTNEYGPGTSGRVEHTYTPATQRWLKIRNVAGNLYFDTSPDGSSWTVLRSFGRTIPDISTMWLGWVSGFYGTEPSPGTALYDNFNQVPFRFKIQGATARIARAVTKTQGALARIALRPMKTQSATARIALRPTKTQGATAAIGGTGTKTQGALARIASFVSKTQAATARIAMGRSIGQSATARIYFSVQRWCSQGATARISMAVFTPPTVLANSPNYPEGTNDPVYPVPPQSRQLFKFFKPRAVGQTVLRMPDGSYKVGQKFTVDQINQASKVYLGGHRYPVTGPEYLELVAAGFDVQTGVSE